jgi:DMSO/TMAO reductase YedYZ molybdopterin-dependent catalytic subunit
VEGPRDERLIVVTREPFNAETPLSEQVGLITPNALHYVRDHFAVPRWQRLVVDGEVERPLELGLDDLLAMPRRSLVVTLECAGNGRAFLEPPIPGEQWRVGAVGTAEWTGVPLRHVLALARPKPSAVEIVFAGADAGDVQAAGGRIAFERSLPVSAGRAEDVLLAFAMNGDPLPADHGAPLRLVVPGAYGMASVKWLARITLSARVFRGFYQADRYVVDGAPLPPIAVRAVITSPADGAVVSGPTVVAGYCWSGGSPVSRVEVSDDGGRTWADAELAPSISRYAWRRWERAWTPRGPGEARLIARAWTADGEGQPLEPRRVGSLGYLNNGARPVTVRVGAAT